MEEVSFYKLACQTRVLNTKDQWDSLFFKKNCKLIVSPFILFAQYAWALASVRSFKH